MVEDAFDSLDEAAVAGAHGLGWAPPLLSPIDVLSFGNSFDIMLNKPAAHPQPHPPPSQPQPQLPLVSTPMTLSHVSHIHSSSPQQHPVPLAPAPPPPLQPAQIHAATSPALLALATANSVKREPRPVKRRAQKKRGVVLPSRTTTMTNASKIAVNPTIARLSRVEETLEFGALSDIGGTTAARSRQMSEEERRVMLYKRKLRNRASAARSREKRCRTITELSKEIQSLIEQTAKLRQESEQRALENAQLVADNKKLVQENIRLSSLLLSSDSSTTTSS